MVLVGRTRYREVLERIKEGANEAGGCSAILFVAPECDALCACHVVTHLLRSEHVQYKIKPAAGLEDLKRANETLVKDNDELRTIVLINCAGAIDVSKVFSLVNSEISCYVIDSHRPIHLGNIYDRHNRVFVLDDVLETIGSDDLPEDDSDLSLGDMSTSSSSDSSEDEYGDAGDDLDGGRKRKRREKRTNRRIRKRTLTHYYVSSSFGVPSAMVAYELSKDCSKDTNDLLWFAIVGLTSYYVQGDIDHGRYIQLLQDVQIDVANKNGVGKTTMTVGEDDTIVPVAEDGRINVELDYRFMLYRHWNLYESMLYSDYVATSMQLWTSQGKARLARFIARVGIPLQQCRQNFAYLSDRLRNRLRASTDDCSKEFKLEEILFHTFSRQDGFSSMMSASDLVHTTTALLECETEATAANRTAAVSTARETEKATDAAASTTTSNGDSGRQNNNDDEVVENADEDKLWIDRFNLAYDALRPNRRAIHDRGVACAKRLQKIVYQMASSVIERKQVRNSGPFRYTLLQNLTVSEASYFVQPRVLARLAKFIVNAFREQGKWAERRSKPYVMCVANNKRGTHLVVGVMCPGRFQVEKNYLGSAFRMAAESVDATYKHDGFHVAAIELGKGASPTHFLSALHDKLSDA